MHPYDEAVQYVLNKNDHHDAFDWLSQVGSPYAVIHELSHQATRETIERASILGAESVSVVGQVSLTDLAENNIDMLLIRLPADVESRRRLFEFEAAIATQTGFMPSIDEGQETILLRWT